MNDGRCFKCGNIHPDMGTAGCPADALPITGTAFKYVAIVNHYPDSMDKTMNHYESKLTLLREALEDTTKFIETFHCQCEPETGNAPCARCYIIKRNRDALKGGKS